MSAKVTEKLSKVTADILFEEIPEKTVNLVKDCILDSIGTMLAGTTVSSPQILWNVLSDYVAKTQESAIYNRGLKTSCMDAAFLNSTCAHSVEMDDFHRKGLVHPAVTIIPAALAVAEKQQSIGKELIIAVTMGYEAVCRLGMTTGVKQYARGFHPTATCGVFGAAIAAGRLWKLNDKVLANALGIAGGFASGIKEWRVEGAMTKPLQVGRAAQSGVLAVALASGGYTGPKTVLEGKYGFCQAYGTVSKIDETFEGLGKSFEIENISFKPYASCRFTHPAIEGVLRLKAEKGIEKHRIKDILIKLPKEMYLGVMSPEDRKYEPKTMSDAQFSLPYCIAAAIVKGNVLLSEFYPECLRDPDVLKIARRVRAEVCPECEDVFPERTRQIVNITMDDSKAYTYKIDYPKGDPENPMSKEDLHGKFKKLVTPILGKTATKDVIEIIGNLEITDDLNPLYRILCKRDF